MSDAGPGPVAPAAPGAPAPAADEGGRFTPAEGAALLRRLQESVATRVIGAQPTVEALLIAVGSGGHALMEGVPGIAKTYLARRFARTLGLSFQRIQFTPDMLPSDIVGGISLDPRDRSFVYRPGPIFAHVVLADEINRAPPKVQSALLEAMQERQVTVDRQSHPLPSPFLVIATENPVEHEGTYPLPEAELDRFLFRWILGYPRRADEEKIVRTQLDEDRETVPPDALDPGTIDRLLRSIPAAHVSPEVIAYGTAIVRATREDPRLLLGASPRAAVQLVRAARAAAFLAGRDYVLPDDVQRLVVPVLNHRVVIRPEFVPRRGDALTREGRGGATRAVLDDLVSKVAVPR
jgi:MoxR-like ATPase